MTTLEKVKRLEKYIASDVAAFDPVLDITIEKLLKRESARVGDIQQRLMKQLEEFEDRYGLKTTEFRDRYDKGLMGDEVDFVEWSATIDMLANIQKSLDLLQEGSLA